MLQENLSMIKFSCIKKYYCKGDRPMKNYIQVMPLNDIGVIVWHNSGL